MMMVQQQQGWDGMPQNSDVPLTRKQQWLCIRHSEPLPLSDHRARGDHVEDRRLASDEVTSQDNNAVILCDSGPDSCAVNWAPVFWRGSRLCRRESIHRAPVELPCYSAKAVTRQRGPTVRFNTVVQVAIVPSHRELDEATVNQMWWGAADLSLFRSAAIVFFRKYGKGSDVEEAEVFETVGPSPGMPYLHATAGTQTPRAAGDESPQRRRKAPGGQGGIGDGQDGRKSRFRFRGRSLSTSEGRRTTRGVFFSSPRSGRATRRRQKGADRDDSPYPPSRSRISAPATAGVDSIFAKNLLVQKPRYSRATSSEEHSRHAGAPPSVVYKSEPTGSHKLALTNPLDIAYE